MNKDAQGKFVSATVIGGYAFNNASIKADQWEGGTFSYIITKTEVPNLYDVNPSAFVDQDFGMQFFNDAGDVTYDSRYETCYAESTTARPVTYTGWRYFDGTVTGGQIRSTGIANSMIFGRGNIPRTGKQFDGIALNSTCAFTQISWASYAYGVVNLNTFYLGTQLMIGVFTDGNDLLNLASTSYERGMFNTAQGFNVEFCGKRDVILGYFGDEFYPYERRLEFGKSSTKLISTIAKQIKSPDNKLTFGHASVNPKYISFRAQLYPISKKLTFAYAAKLFSSKVSRIYPNVAPKNGQLETDNGGIDTLAKNVSFLNIGTSPTQNKFGLFQYRYDQQFEIDYVDSVIASETAAELGTFDSAIYVPTIFSYANISDGQGARLSFDPFVTLFSTTAKINQ